jgi:spore coat polysaccharide biosynthesis predicted glycosyltransferase SpsG
LIFSDPKPILLVPACEKGRGGGHLSRCLFLLRALQERGREVFLWIPEELEDDIFKRFPDFFENADHVRGLIYSKQEELSGRAWDFIVLDRFRTSSGEFAFWAALSGRSFGPLIGIDEGGPCRRRFDFLVDLLPALAGPEPNLCAPALLPLPHARRPVAAKSPTIPLRVLISFGAEDSAGLGFSAARSLVKTNLDITLIAQALNRDSSGEESSGLEGVKVIGTIPNLREHLAEYDLLITHFGLGAFEAVYARVPVLLISPTAYHEKLKQNAGFFSLGHGAKAFRRLKKLRLDRKLLNTLSRSGEEIARRFGLEDTFSIHPSFRMNMNVNPMWNYIFRQRFSFKN